MNNQNKTSKKEITFRILKTIALAGAVTAAVLAPGVALAFSSSVSRKKQNKCNSHRYAVTKTVWRLQKNGFLQTNPNGKISLTPKGKRLLARYQLKELTIKKPKKWDGKWRVIAFDVWENRRRARNLLRKTLQNLGFIKLQASLWIYPYDCEEIIELLKTDLKISPAIQYMIVEKMNRDNWLRKHFNLPS